MNNSSAAQTESNPGSVKSSAQGEQNSSVSDPSLVPGNDFRNSSTSPFMAPDFSAFRSAYAVTARLAGRLNAAVVSDAEHQALLNERQELLDKKLAQKITRQESNRLEYVRWSLDRIEDAKHGAIIDKIENSVNVYENFLAQIQSLHQQLQQKTNKNLK